MTQDRDLTRDLEHWLEDVPSSAPAMSRATIRGRVRETRQRPPWLVRERGEPYVRPPRVSGRMLFVGFTILALTGATIGLASLGGQVGLRAARSPEITAFPVEGQPLGMAYLSGSVWAGMTDTLAVARIDPATGVSTNVLSLGRNCVAMGGVGAGALWESTCQAGPLVRIDPATNTPRAVPIEGQGQVAATIPFEGDVAWITIDADAGTFVRYDASAGEVISRGDIEPLGGAVFAAGFGSGWGVNGFGGDEPLGMIRIDAENHADVTRIETELPPVFGVPIGDALWVVTGIEGTDRAVLVRVDPDTNTATPVLEFGFWELHMAVIGTDLWLLDGSEPATLHRVDTRTNEITQTISVGGEANGLTTDGERLWLSLLGAQEVVRVDPGD